MDTPAPAKPLALVTGAARGVGYDLALQFAQHGYDLMLVDADDGIRDAAKLLRAYGSEVEYVQMELTSRRSVEELYLKALRLGRPLDAVVINTGGNPSGDSSRLTHLEADLDFAQLNVISMVHLAKRVLPDMVRRGLGWVLFTLSVATEMPGSFEDLFAASQAFLGSYAAAVRRDLCDLGITVTTLMPAALEPRALLGTSSAEALHAASAPREPRHLALPSFEDLRTGGDEILAEWVSPAPTVAKPTVLPARSPSLRARAKPAIPQAPTQRA